MRRLFLTIFVVTGIIAWLYFKGQPPRRDSAAQDVTQHRAEQLETVPGSKPSGAGDLGAKLARLPKWTTGTAAAVARALEPCAASLASHADWLEQVRELRMEGSVPKLLEEYPASITLLLLAHPDARAALAEGILSAPGRPGQELLLGTCAKYVDASALSQWGRALKAQGPTIAHLLAVCPTWPVDGIFAYERGRQGDGAAQEMARLYDNWVNDALQAPEHELPSMVQFLIEASPEVRGRLQKDASFRDKFPEMWRNFKGCVQETQQRFKDVPMWHCFGDDPKLWDLLMRPNGPALFMNAGSLATRMLLGPHAVTGAEAQARVERLLLAQYAEVYQAMESLGENPSFQNVITRNFLNDDQVAIACSRLNAARSSKPGGDLELLAKWTSGDEAELKHMAIGSEPLSCVRKVAGYSFINAFLKLTDGRRLTAADGASMAMDIYTIGKMFLTHGATLASGAKNFALRAAQDMAQGLAEDALSHRFTSAAGNPTNARLALYGVLQHQAADAKRPLLREEMDVTVATHAALVSGGTRYALDKCEKLGGQFRQASPAHLLVTLPGTMAGADPLAAAVRRTAEKAEAAPDDAAAWQQNLGAWWLYAWALR